MLHKRCQSCFQPVYHAEKVMAAGKLYHSDTCGKRLDSRSVNDHENSIYCNFCYSNLFGPSGYGFGVLRIKKTDQSTS
ncbi:unnamed protein product [Bursaphelenchus xylophilus]|uniref:(pine wood nematode) hypothetical protein n=1 Tax=Bursaphelenchus xylophilus TaxID=6326 RepID=A0A7I8WJW0_BURXY|nr:unnamed protein product [Bursaphelenchus xylophilus]CAG9107497.1 unnamed protein product [Bursaphelenchus xylophilus]